MAPWMSSSTGTTWTSGLLLTELYSTATPQPSLIPLVMEKAKETTGRTNYCSGLRIFDCTNHLGKNAGAKAFEVGHRLHKTCTSCPDRITQMGAVDKRQPKERRGLNVPAHPLVKSSRTRESGEPVKE
mmetsp:Transcript_27862/g.85057  ORF Transcript_27862/g.85057 Transcript_27862/m.85057 type:complete len:128 (+) Transcript_27862:1053-1436(+)